MVCSGLLSVHSREHYHAIMLRKHIARIYLTMHFCLLQANIEIMRNRCRSVSVKFLVDLDGTLRSISKLNSTGPDID